MNILAADDEKNALAALQETIEEIVPNAVIYAFRSGTKAMECAKKVRFEVAFLDIEMRDMSGLELALQLKDLQTKINIVFVTGYSEYALDAINLYASGYLLKPVTEEKVMQAMENLRHPIVLPETEKLRVQCFGNFEVFSKGQPLEFSRKRSKELFAYFIDRCGAGSSMEDIVNVLWEDGVYGISRRNQVHSFLSDLKKTLQAAGAGDVLIRQYNNYSIDTKKVDCDFYRLLGSDPAAVNLYNGEYMTQYSWAELTAGSLMTRMLK